MRADKQLNHFLNKAKKDVRLLPSHISIYVAVVSLWSNSNIKNVFRIIRKDIMVLSHINSIATYHKCIRQLEDFGYIKYRSSYNSYEGCTIELCH